MKTAQIPLSALTPNFGITDISFIKANEEKPLSSLLLGQERLVRAFNLAKSLENQNLFIADFQGYDRQLLFMTLMDNNSEYIYLSGNIRRKQLIGYKDTASGLWHQGALAQPKTLFICAESLWKKENLWELVIHSLQQKNIEVSNEQIIPVRAKVILIGYPDIYAGIRYQDSRLNKLFPILGEINSEIDTNKYRIESYCNWLKALAQIANFEIEEQAFHSLLNYSSKLTEHQQRLSLASSEFIQLLDQACALTDTKLLTQEAINKAIQEKKYRHSASEEFSGQSFDDSFINLPTTGEVIGQINGLTVIDSIDYCYGEPARITTSVHYGDGEVADIERKSELGGNIHAKGLMILTSCLYRIFGRDEPLHLNANIVFEQSYQEIDGDSASLAEYCCLISAIAEKPILQSLAITGALDQLGNVQAIGGVNEKIEGFFNLCERRGLTGNQGVIIPKANLLQLNLSEKIISAIKEKKFHLYQVSHMNEAVELLMQLPAGQADENNNFPSNTLYGMVQQRLDKLAGNIDEELSFWTKLRIKLRLFS